MIAFISRCHCILLCILYMYKFIKMQKYICVAVTQLGEAIVEPDELKSLCLETMWTCSNLSDREVRTFI